MRRLRGELALTPVVPRYFIMLTGASCAGKSTLVSAYEDRLAVIHSDDMMGQMFDLIREPELGGSIDQTALWSARVDAKVDRDGIMGLLTRDAARGLPRDRAILAAGYIYMFRDLRRVTMQALSNRPDLPVRFLLMHIEPPQDIHAERSRERYGFSYESALETVRGQRVLFEPVTDEPGLDYVKIADEGEFVAALEQRGVFVPVRVDRAKPARGWRDGWSRRTPAK